MYSSYVHFLHYTFYCLYFLLGFFEVVDLSCKLNTKAYIMHALISDELLNVFQIFNERKFSMKNESSLKKLDQGKHFLQSSLFTNSSIHFLRR